MNSIKVWFPDFYTEYHRLPELGEQLAKELRKFGIDPVKEPSRECVTIFCGSFFKSQDVEKFRRNKRCSSMPVVHYNWDIYPFQVNGDPTRTLVQWWKEYIAVLSHRTYDILVPSYCTTLRTQEFTGRTSTVIKSCAHTWETDAPVMRGDYVVNVMRRYSEDPNADLLREVCDEISIPLFQPDCSMDWEGFKRLIVGARFLVSPYYEASTGGMTLLEGYYHGKDVLLSNSPRHGAVDYFGDRGDYFQWNDRESLKTKLNEMWDRAPANDLEERREWIRTEYSEERFAKDIAERLWKCYERR